MDIGFIIVNFKQPDRRFRFIMGVPVSIRPCPTTVLFLWYEYPNMEK